ncbi:GNAT family N-acetyltransferase [bacterium]|nr:GNAT family N-acetyltransferase [candidate division CSSED10-310 bacterium]
MLRLLSSWNPERIENLLPDDVYSLFARSVVNGTAKGRIYYDESVHPPVVAVVSSEEERCFFTLKTAGEDKNLWTEQFSATVLKDQYEENNASIECFLQKNADESVHAILKELLAVWVPAYLYYGNSDRLHGNLPVVIPDGFELIPVDHTFRAKKSLKNKKLVLDEWDQRQAGVNGVSGFCLVKDSTVASVCHIDFRHGDAIEIGVITDQRFKKRKLATAVAANTVHFFISNGINKILWHAPVDNIGSQKVAEAIGLCIDSEFGEYHAHYNAGYSLLMQGYRLFQKGKYRDAAQMYTQALEKDKTEEKAFAGIHTRQEVVSWIINCYALENDVPSIMHVIEDLIVRKECSRSCLLAIVNSSENCAEIRESMAWRTYCAAGADPPTRRRSFAS